MNIRRENDAQIIRLDNVLFAGGRQGTIYELPGYSDLVAKILLTQSSATDARLEAQRQTSLPTSIDGGQVTIMWPKGRIYSHPDGDVIGYEMEYARGKQPIIDYYNPTGSRPYLDYAFRLRVARNVASAVALAHDHGLVIGDLSHSNVLVGRDGSISLIDTDSWQITTPSQIIRCPVATPEYTPPELHGCDLSTLDREPWHDTFALAVLIHQLLVLGNHPFAADHVAGPDLSLQQRIRQGVWPYSKKSRQGYRPRPGAPFDLLHPDLRILATRCFEDGHSLPSLRPKAIEWKQTLDQASADRVFLAAIAQSESQAMSDQRVAVSSKAAHAQQLPKVEIRQLLKKKRVIYVAAALTAAAIAYWAFTDSPVPAPPHHFEEIYGPGKPTPTLWKNLAEEPD